MPLPTIPCDIDMVPTKENIIEKIREWIITLEFAPGEKIADIDIASYFGVSRTPVREVLKILEQQKLIVTYPGRATVIAELQTEKIDELYVPMRTLQCLAVKIAADKATEEDIAEYLNTVIQGDKTDVNVRKAIIKTFVRKVILYKDKVVITYNFSDKPITKPTTEETLDVERQLTTALSTPDSLYKLENFPPMS